MNQLETVFVVRVRDSKGRSDCAVYMDSSDDICVMVGPLTFENSAYHLPRWCENHGLSLTKNVLCLGVEDNDNIRIMSQEVSRQS
jgi:hypothetical protein